MLHNALICISALMFVLGKNNVEERNIQSLLPLHDNHLQEDTNFDSLKTPSSINGGGGLDEERNGGSLVNENCWIYAPHHKMNTQKSRTELNRIKRELGHMGSIFVNKFFDSSEVEYRRGRSEKDAEESRRVEDEDEEKEDQTKIRDPEFIEQQQNAANLTNRTKEVFDNIENAKIGEEKDEKGEVCCETEAPPKSSRRGEFVENNSKKSALGSSDTLEMHFYSHLPDGRNTEISPENEESLLINLYPDLAKNHAFRTPEKYDYVALLSDGESKLVQVPAVKLTVVPAVGSRRRRTDNFGPFYITKFKTHPSHSKFEPTGNLFRNDKPSSCHEWTHVPILFVNTIPDSEGKFKRSQNYNIPENQYLRDADLLIRNIKTSLRMGLYDAKKGADAGILMDSKTNPNSVGDGIKPFKNGVMEEEVQAGDGSNTEQRLDDCDFKQG